jgi:hypothetical protein
MQLRMNDKLSCILASLGLFLAPSLAHAQETPSPESPVTTAEPPASEGASPKPAEDEGHPGFEIDASVGYAVPLGNIANTVGIGSGFGGQVPFSAQIGANVIPSLFLGGYATLAPGGAGGTIADSCNTNNISCNSVSSHAGFVTEYRFLPGHSVQPWLGYGFGYEWNTLHMSDLSGHSASVQATGWEFAHIRGGVDLLAHSAVAFGLYMDVGIGQYDHVDQQGLSSPGGDIAEKALHEWVSFGVRGRLMP